MNHWLRSYFVAMGYVLLGVLGRVWSAELPTAAGEAKTSAEGTEQTVVLPPFIVATMRMDKRPWRYGTAPGLEILTRASDEDTRRVVSAYRRTWWIEDHVLPQSWLQAPPVRYTLIIDDTDPKTAGYVVAPAGADASPVIQDNMDRAKGRRTEVLAAPLEEKPRDSLGLDLSDFGFSSHSKSTGWMRVGDHDTAALSANVFGGPDVFQAPTGLDRLDRCVPALPSWLIAGLTGRFGLFEMRGSVGVIRSSDRTVGPFVIFRGARWISDEETRRLKKAIVKTREKTEIPFVPLAQFFAEPSVPDDRGALWESEAGLFVRWGLFEHRGFFGPDKKAAERRQAFVRFVQRARLEPVTESVFRECFGCSFDAMEHVLTDFLKTTLAERIEITLHVPMEFPELKLRPATEGQSGRMLGDWLRMQAQSADPRTPAMRRQFLDAAGRMLTRAYEMDDGLPPDAATASPGGKQSPPKPRQEGEPAVRLKPFVVSADRIHDLGLLAVLGLYEHDLGDDDKARVLLEKAAQGGMVRPAAYLVLAQLRHQQAVAKPLGRDGRMSAQQADSVLEAAKVALRSGATAEAWDLAVATLAQCETKPSTADITRIVAGVAQFPRESALALRTARLCVQVGELASAADLIARSLPFAEDDETKQMFQALLHSIGPGAR